MTRLPPLKSLQAFRFAAEAQSFKIAAAQLNVTPTAISQQIKTLEQSLGLTLFRRLTREVELTQEGRQLLPHISKAFSAMEEGIAQLTHDPEPNRLTITALPSFAARWLVPRLGLFQEIAPDVNIHLLPSLGLTEFEGSDLDLAIRFGQGHYPGLSSHLLLEDYLLPVCHPSLIHTNKPVAQQLAALPYLEDNGVDMEMARPIFQQALGIEFQKESTKLSVSDATMLVEAILSGQGFALLRYGLVYDLLERGSVICPIPLYLKSHYDFYLVAPESNFKRPKVRQFESWIRKEIKIIETSWVDFHRTQLNQIEPLNA